MKTEPTEAYEAVKYYEANNINIDAFRAKKLCDMAFYEGQSSPKIKQLEWGFYGTYYSAETPVIDYMITQENDFVENDGDCALWINGFPISHSTLDEAKAAAQADFERRVMECLDFKAQQKQALINMMRMDEDQ